MSRLAITVLPILLSHYLHMQIYCARGWPLTACPLKRSRTKESRKDRGTRPTRRAIQIALSSR